MVALAGRGPSSDIAPELHMKRQRGSCVDCPLAGQRSTIGRPRIEAEAGPGRIA